MSTFLIIAGEVSGDMHAAKLVSAVRERLPGARFVGIGGERMRAAGVEIFHDTREMAVMGFSEVLRRLGFFRTVLREITDKARELRPDAVILVDYPGFNLRFAAATHRLGLKTVYYICPQVWAWHRSRIPKMARILDRLITIFPFEGSFFAGTPLKADFVGHPLVDEARKALSEPTPPLPWKGEPRIAVLPGSRVHEVQRLLPVMWRAAALIAEKRPSAAFMIPAPSPEIARVVRDTIALLPAGPENWSIEDGNARHVLRQARAAMVASGTATIEAALMSCPSVIAYRLSAFSYLLGRMLVRVKNVGMVNIVAGEEICPEFIQRDATPGALAGAIDPLIDDTPRRATMLAGLERVSAALGDGGTEQRAAGIILEELSEAAGLKEG